MAELPKGGFDLFIMLQGAFVQRGASWQGVALSRRSIEGSDWRFWFKDAFHWDSHLSCFTTSSWNYNICMILVISNFLLLPSVFVVFSRLDSFYTISTQRILYVSRLFLVSLVLWIDKPWGNTLREKLHDLARLRYINCGAKERQQQVLWILTQGRTPLDDGFLQQKTSRN